MIEEEAQYGYKPSENRFAQEETKKEEQRGRQASTEPDPVKIKIWRVSQAFTAPHCGKLTATINLPAVLCFKSKSICSIHICTICSAEKNLEIEQFLTDCGVTISDIIVFAINLWVEIESLKCVDCARIFSQIIVHYVAESG